MGRHKKYENPEEVITTFFESVSESYNHPAAGEEGRGGEQGRDGKKKQELLADEFGVSRLKIRKILITTGDVVYPATKQIQAALDAGIPLPVVAEKLNMSRSTASSLVGYSKGVYGLDVSAAADRTALYRERKNTLQNLQAAISSGTVDEQRLMLWKCVCLFQGYPFQTAGRRNRSGAKFRYEVSEPGSSGGRHYDGEEVEGFGNEIFVIPASGEGKGKRRDKGISRSSVDYAFRIALEGNVKGPKQLKIYGCSYVYAVFKRFGLIEEE